MLPPQAPSYWTQTAATTPFDPLAGDLSTEVAIVGGGIVGVTLAFLLQARGHRASPLLEARRVGQQVSGLHHRQGDVAARPALRDGSCTASAARPRGCTASPTRPRWNGSWTSSRGWASTATCAGPTPTRTPSRPRASPRCARKPRSPRSSACRRRSCSNRPLPFPIRGAVRFDGAGAVPSAALRRRARRALRRAGGVVAEGHARARRRRVRRRVPHRVRARRRVIAEHVVARHQPAVRQPRRTFREDLPVRARRGGGAASGRRDDARPRACTSRRAARRARCGSSTTRQLAWLIATGGGYKTGQGDPVRRDGRPRRLAPASASASPTSRSAGSTRTSTPTTGCRTSAASPAMLEARMDGDGLQRLGHDRAARSPR